jgi:hypothetical protein
MREKIRVKLPDGREAIAMPIEINQTSEQWNHYLLDDGSSLRVKLVITKVSRIDNEYDPEGNPVYVFQSTNITSVSSPEDIKKRPQ